ncbi:MAG: hypothetical protein V3R89_06485, partial [Thermoanaerobaculia bacterium]
LESGEYSAPGIATLKTEKWRKIKIRWQAASAPGGEDGFVRLLRGKKLIWSLEDLDNDAHRINGIRFGQVTKGRKKTNGQVFIDNFKSEWEE